MTVHRGKPCSMAEFAALWGNHDLLLSDIAARVGAAERTIAYRAKVMGLPPRAQARRQRFAIDTALFTDMWRAGVAVEEIARHFRRSLRTVANIRRRLGLDARPAWVIPPVTLARFMADRADAELCARMADTAAAERAQWALAEMVDAKTTAWKRRAA